MKLLIAILSCHARPEYRQAQRETWIPEIPLDVDYRFFLGGGTTSEPDAVCLECPDDYNSLTKKTKAVMQWAEARDYDFAYKGDDDSFVRPALLLSSGFEQYPYYGWTEGREGPVSAGCSYEHYAWAQGGAGYWVDRKSIKILAEHLRERRHCEDAAVGETLHSFGIEPAHDARYYPEAFPKHRENPEPYITLHKCNPEQMRAVHERLIGVKC